MDIFSKSGNAQAFEINALLMHYKRNIKCAEKVKYRLVLDIKYDIIK